MHFQYQYPLSGSGRKPLVEAMSQILDQPAVYQGAPSFAYTVGDYTVDRNGVLSCGDHAQSENMETLVETLRVRGFTAESAAPEQETSISEDAAAETTMHQEEAEENRGSLEGMPGAVQKSDSPDTLTVEIPDTDFNPEARENLKKIVASKETLLKQVLEADDLPIVQRDGKLAFPWFTLHGWDGEADAYSRLIAAICKMAKTQKRVTAVEKPMENAKYTMRLFLVRLGFIGDEYKTARHILLRNLTGNSSWKSGHQPKQAATGTENVEIPPDPSSAEQETAVAKDVQPAMLRKEDEGGEAYGK